VKYMTTDAVTALLAAPDPGTRLGLRDQFFMILMYDLAARDAEMLALNLTDIDTRRLTADLLGKGSKPRRLPITIDTAGTLTATPPFSTPARNQRPRCSTPCGTIVRYGCLTTTSPGSSTSTPLLPKPNAPTSPPGPPSHAPPLTGHASLPGRHALALLTEWLGHADPETTLVYAHADTEMKRRALEKANSPTAQSPLPAPLWHDREDIIRRLCGLKE